MIFLQDVEELLPKNVIENDFFGEPEVRAKNKMFSGTKERRHWDRRELASDHLAQATNTLLERNGLDPKTDIDMILTNVSLPDEPFTGCGAVINKKIKGKIPHVYDIQNTGCISFVYLVEMAHTFMQAGKIKNALICVSQTAGARIFGQEDTRQLAQSAIPGDGCAVALVNNEKGHQFMEFVLNNNPDYSEDMYADYGEEKKWWEHRTHTGCVSFDEEKTGLIIARGNKLVPEAIYAACDKSRVKITDLDYLITNQPNKLFLRNWCEASLMKEDQHLNSFERYANLFGAAIPINLAEESKKGTFKEGDLICLAGFAHAGDFSGATVLKW